MIKSCYIFFCFSLGQEFACSMAMLYVDYDLFARGLATFGARTALT